jgi:hypothetical protein
MKKILVTTAIIAALTITSAAAATNGDIEKSQTLPLTQKVSVQQDNSSGRIEYSKQTNIRPDGKIGSVTESWVDTVTHARRDDSKFFEKDGTSSFSSYYFLDHYKKMVNIRKDIQEKPAQGTITTFSDRVAAYNDSLYDLNTISAVKDQYTKPEWKSEGTINTNDGKTLKKLSQSFDLKENPKTKMLYNTDKPVSLVNFAYIDEEAGLPVKTESYTVIDGKSTLESTTVFEYKKIEADESLFSTDGFKLQQLPEVDFDPANGVG